MICGRAVRTCSLPTDPASWLALQIARSWFAPETWWRRGGRPRNPGNRKGVLQTDRVARGSTRAGGIARSPVDVPPHCDPSLLLPLLQKVVNARADSFHVFAGAVVLAVRPSIFFKYKDLKDCFARCTKTRR